jgi:hypothetical protein
VRRDGPVIWRHVQAMRAQPNPPEAERREFAANFMSRFGNETDSDDFAYQIVRAYTAR